MNFTDKISEEDFVKEHEETDATFDSRRKIFRSSDWTSARKAVTQPSSNLNRSEDLRAKDSKLNSIRKTEKNF